MTLTCLAFMAIATLDPVTPAAAVQRRALANAEAVRIAFIDASMNARPVDLVRVETPGGGRAGNASGTLVFIDAAGPQSIPPSAALALAPEWWIIDLATGAESGRLGDARESLRTGPAAGSAGAITLDDGQRYVGAIAPPAVDDAPDDQTLRWMHPRLGAFGVPLDRLSRITLATGSVPPGEPGADTVILRNGDRLIGFVDGVGSELIITLSGGAGHAPARIPIDQVAVVHLDNPARPPTGAVVWLADGSVVALDQLAIDAGAGRVTLAARPAGASGQAAAAASIDLSDLRSVVFDASRIKPLASLKMSSFAPAAGRRIAPPPRLRPVVGSDQGEQPSPLGADDIELPGPMLVEWVLPPSGAPARLAGWVTLDPAAALWGDCIVSIAVLDAASGGQAREIARGRVNGAAPAFAVNAPLPRSADGAPSRLRITVDAGERGPIHDRVVLRRMLIAQGGDR